MDIENIAPGMPGTTSESHDGDDYTEQLDVRLGPMDMTYHDSIHFVERDYAAKTALVDASTVSRDIVLANPLNRSSSQHTSAEQAIGAPNNDGMSSWPIIKCLGNNGERRVLSPLVMINRSCIKLVTETHGPKSNNRS
tara:strand:- start:395 stop:808 length:414 start_codon:yes stop_codon:yes gene_type:complete